MIWFFILLTTEFVSSSLSGSRLICLGKLSNLSSTYVSIKHRMVLLFYSSLIRREISQEIQVHHKTTSLNDRVGLVDDLLLIQSHFLFPLNKWATRIWKYTISIQFPLFLKKRSFFSPHHSFFWILHKESKTETRRMVPGLFLLYIRNSINYMLSTS